MSRDQAVKLGGNTILIGMFLGVMSFFSTWVFNTVLDNQVLTTKHGEMFLPLASAVEDLNVVTHKMNIDSNMRNYDMIDALNKISVRMEKNENRLHNVEKDCEDNHATIEACKSMHYREIK